jgi:flagellar basal body-associated protein FliL
LGYVLLGPKLKIDLGFKLHPGFAQANYDEKFDYDVHKEFVPLSEEGEYPQFVFLLDKVIVNIQPSESSSSNPMVAMRLYFESNSRQGAIEIKDREKEVRDTTQRVLETYAYDRIITARGKIEFKEQLRREITSIMNTGIIKNIYIDDILIKP